MRNMNIKIIEDKQNKKSGKNNVFFHHIHSVTFFLKILSGDFLRLLRSVREAFLIYKKWHTVVL